MSNVNISAKQNRSNSTLATLGWDEVRATSIYNRIGSINVLMDVSGRMDCDTDCQAFWNPADGSGRKQPKRLVAPEAKFVHRTN